MEPKNAGEYREGNGFAKVWFWEARVPMVKKIIDLIILIIMFHLLLIPEGLLASSLGPSGGLTVSGKYGGDDFLAIGPPPGVYLINYTFFYTANKFKDYNGDEVKNGPFEDFKIRAAGNIIRPIYVSKKKIFGSFWGMDMGIPLIDKQIESRYFDDSDSGLGDIILCPLWLAWHTNVFHYLLSFDVITPTGRYDKNDLVNVGNNHWTFEPLFSVTAVFPGGLDLNLNLLYDINWKNNDFIDPRTRKETTYKAGQAFHMDYAIGYEIIKNQRIGVVGYYWKDVTDDEIGGQEIGDSRGQVFSFGPAYSLNWNKLTISLKTQFEMAVKNRPQGTMSWLRLLYAF